MRSGEARPARGGNEPGDQVQGSLEGILPPYEPRTTAKESIDASKPHVKKTPGRARDDDGKGPDALRASLDVLEENITLLLARHESLAAHVADEERRRSGAIDPIELERRVNTLQAEKERLERHSAFLEERIRGLLSRVRYVIES